MKKKLFLLLLLAIYTLAGFAKQRTESEALNIARSFYEKSSKLKGGVSLTLAYAGKDVSATRSASSNVHYYIFNKGGEGFVVVSGDDRAKDILGYSAEGAFDYATAPENFKYWLNFYAEEIKTLAGQPEMQN
ncbi:MAG: Spi family protease inhibitor, partial [Prevotella sp.]|nr:Spi family protease inhibitor [Prevotella sp.]